MTIENVLKGERANWIHVNVMKEISDKSDNYVIADASGIAVLKMPSDSEIKQKLNLGKGIRIVKPKKIATNVITFDPKLKPIETKPIPSLSISEENINNLLTEFANTPELSKSPVKILAGEMTFNQIEHIQDTGIVPRILAYAKIISRHIDSKYGGYRICKLVDKNGDQLEINLYNRFKERVEENELYVMEKLKKTTLQTDGSIQSATTGYTNIIHATKEQKESFRDVKITTHVITGTCVIYFDLDKFQ